MNKKTTNKIILGIILLLAFCFLPGSASGVEVKGRISVEDFMSSDSNSSQSRNVLTSRLRFDAAKFNEADNYSLHFDGRLRNTLSEGDYNSAISEQRISKLYMAFQTGPAEGFYLALGRFWPKENSLERVDGANVVYSWKSFGVGLFGGTQPDPYTEDFSTDYTAFGSYIFYRKQTLTANLSLTHKGFNGGTDREYLYGQLSYMPSRKVRIYSTITADLNQDSKDMELTNAIAEITYRPTKKARLTLGFNRFSAVELFESMDFDFIGSKQQSLYARGSYNLTKRYSTYGKVERRTSDIEFDDSGTRDTNIFQLGLKNGNLLNTKIVMDINAVVTSSYNSDYSTYSLSFNRNMWEKLELSTHASYSRTSYQLTDVTDDSLSYGLSGYLIISKSWNLLVSYDGTKSDEYTTNNVLSKLTYKF